jgi:2-octaprenylphenol hydroxylase
LNNLGVWQLLDTERLGRFSHMMVWDGEGTALTEFDARDVHAEHLGHIIENEEITGALVQRLEGLADVELVAPALLEEIRPGAKDHRLLFDLERQVDCKLVIGADGGNSTVRTLAGIDTRQWSYGHHALVTTLRTEHVHQATAWQNFTRWGPLAFLPLADDRLCSIVWSVAPEFCAHLKQLDSERFCALVGSAFEFRLGRIECVDQRFSFALQQRYGRRYVVEGIALIGDAAHTIHPLAGQGVNLGFKDVEVLSQELLRALDRDVSPGSMEILQRYERRRMAENLVMMAGMEGFVRLYGKPTPGLNWLRNMGMRMFNDNRLLRTAAIKIATGI